jgi:hypothetical protein
VRLISAAFCISFYGWNKADLFIDAWRSAGFRIVGHVVFRKRYPSSTRFLRYQHEQAYVLSKVWRLAERECIDLAAGRAAKGYKRLPDERRAAVIEARRINPEATQAEIARATGVSRPTVTRIEDGRRRKLAAAKAE